MTSLTQKFRSLTSQSFKESFAAGKSFDERVLRHTAACQQWIKTKNVSTQCQQKPNILCGYPHRTEQLWPITSSTKNWHTVYSRPEKRSH